MTWASRRREESKVTVVTHASHVAGPGAPSSEHIHCRVFVGDDYVGHFLALQLSCLEANPVRVVVPSSMEPLIRQLLRADGGPTRPVVDVVPDFEPWGLAIGDVTLDCSLQRWQEALARTIQALGHGCAWAALQVPEVDGPATTAPPGDLSRLLGLGFRHVGDGVCVLPLATRDFEWMADRVYGRGDRTSGRPPPAVLPDAGVMDPVEALLVQHVTVTAGDVIGRADLDLGDTLVLVEALADAGGRSTSAGTDTARLLAEAARDLVLHLVAERPSRMDLRRVQAVLRAVRAEGRASGGPALEPDSWEAAIGRVNLLLEP